MAWARHVTGQDVNDWTSWDEFESVCVIPGTSARANGDWRTDDEVWVVVKRTIDGNDYRFVEQFQPLDWGDDPNYCWFVDCSPGTSNSAGVDEDIETAETTYTLMHMSGNGVVWDVPLGDREMLGSLDAGQPAVNVGGGVVGLPYTNHPFAVGDVVAINGTTNYNIASATLQASTTSDRLDITHTYLAETFSGDEVVVKQTSTTAGGGRMTSDSSGNLYVGHNWDATNSTFITKIATDGTMTYDDFDWTGYEAPGAVCRGIAITSDDQYLYALVGARVIKFNMATGAVIWAATASVGDAPYALAIDSSGNAYSVHSDADAICKFDADTGAISGMTNMGQEPYVALTGNLQYSCVVDDTLGIVVGGGYMYGLTGWSEEVLGSMYNFGVRTLDNSAGATLRLGDLVVNGAVTSTLTVNSGNIVTDGSYIYVLVLSAQPVLYKLSWNGSALSLVDSATVSAYATGIFLDLYGNLVIVNNDWSVPQSDVFYYYDTDLNYLATIDNVPTSVGKTWDALVGGAWIQGEAIANGVLGTSSVDYGVDVNEMEVAHLPNMNVCVYADGKPLPGTYGVTADANGTYTIDLLDTYDIVIAGLNYYSIYESFPLRARHQYYGSSQTDKVQITDIRLDFYETMGCNLGATYDESTALHFSDDAFATAMAPWSGAKVATFPRGITREPVLYLWEWEPIPMSIRALRPTVNVEYEE